MTEIANDFFQGMCLVSDEDAGRIYMRYYDSMPKLARERIRSACVNICCACVDQETGRRLFNRDYHSRHHSREQIMCQVIDEMEAMCVPHPPLVRI